MLTFLLLLPLTQAIPTGSGDPVAGILDAFRTARVVALGENHGHLEFHDLLLQVLEHPRAPGVIDDIAVEWGNGLYQDVVDRYVSGETVAWDSVTMSWRNSVVSPNTVWDAPVYERFVREVRRINAGLAVSRQYRVILADAPVDWAAVRTVKDLEPFLDRGLAMADRVGRLSLLAGRRALFVAGGLHVHRRPRTFPTRDGIPRGEITPVAWLELRHPGAVYVIQSMGRVVDVVVPELVGTGPPRYLRLVDTPVLAGLDADRVHTLRGRDGAALQVYRRLRFGDLVDAVIIWGPSSLTFPDPDPATYRIDWYWTELNRRSLLLRGQPMDSALRTESSPASGRSPPAPRGPY